MQEQEIKNEELNTLPVDNSISESQVNAPLSEVSSDIPSDIPSEISSEDKKTKRYVTRRPMSRNNSNNRSRTQREKPEFEQKVLGVRRVTRVTSGGRRFSLHATVVIGDRNGRVGVGTGKALDNQGAMEKAFKDAKKNLVKISIDNKKSIKHDVKGKHDSAKIWISPNNEKGLIAGSSARVILSLAGLQNVTSKFHGGTKNKLNNARATMEALKKISIKK
jgi:small subunit ribosomal protein S5